MIIGEALTPFTIDPVSPDAMREWAVFLADPNPIHLDPEAVKAMGLGDRVINQGPANVAYIMNMLAAAFPGAVIENIAARFLDNVYGGERVTAGGTVTAADGAKVTCEIWLEAEGRGRVISGTATVLTK